MARLMTYDWPGNVRELENTLMRAAIVARGTVIGVDHLILEDGDSAAREDLTLEAAVRRHVRMVLELAGGDEGEAAKLLGISAEDVREHLPLTETTTST